MKDKEEILKILQSYTEQCEDHEGSRVIYASCLDDLANEIIENQPQSSTLLCIEEKVIDDMIENAIEEYELSILFVLKELKSKMKPIADVKAEAWDEAVKETISCAEYKDGQEEIPYNFPKMLDRKTKYINGEK